MSPKKQKAHPPMQNTFEDTASPMGEWMLGMWQMVAGTWHPEKKERDMNFRAPPGTQHNTVNPQM